MNILKRTYKLLEVTFNFVPVKKLLVIFLLTVYGLSATGTSIQLHFCCGKLKSVSFTQADNDLCGTHNKPNHKCCKGKSVAFKLQSEQAVDAVKILVPNATAHVPSVNESLADPLTATTSNFHFTWRPPDRDQKLYRLYRVYRI